MRRDRTDRLPLFHLFVVVVVIDKKQIHQKKRIQTSCINQHYCGLAWSIGSQSPFFQFLNFSRTAVAQLNQSATYSAVLWRQLLDPMALAGGGAPPSVRGVLEDRHPRPWPPLLRSDVALGRADCLSVLLARETLSTPPSYWAPSRACMAASASSLVSKSTKQ